MLKKLLIILSIFCVLNFSLVSIEARAGGGSSGGGSGSSGGSSSTSHSHYDHTSQGGPYSSIISTVSFIGFTYFVLQVKRYYSRIKAKEAHWQLKKQMQTLDDQDEFWNNERIKKAVKESYYKIQEAWSNQDIETLKKYLTPDLLDAWTTKLNWYEYQGKRNILKNIRLIEQDVINLYDSKNDDEDYFWVYIEGKMDDRMIDENQQVVEKNTGIFIEYWKFKRQGQSILLDEIKQEDEMFL